MSDRIPRFPKPAPSAVTLMVPILWLSGMDLQAQEAVVVVEENFRAEPSGTVVGRLEPGTRLTVTERDGNWARVTLEGFVWTASMQVRTDDAFDLVISEPDGENIREEPSGRIAGRLVSGALLEEIERVPGWVRVRRAGWVWTPSLEVQEAELAEGSDGAARWIRIGAGEVEVRSEPDGEPVGRVSADADVRVLGDEGNWVRVQLEGWVWRPDLELAPGALQDDAVLRGVTTSELTGDPDRYRGRLIETRLQFISLEAAEQVRIDFYQGEPFLLTRSLEGDRSFVYVAVPSERRDEMTSLIPLETIRVLARVRSTAAAFTGNPILDLLEVERER